MNIAVANRKGGTGKTTFSTSVAVGLAIEGFAVGLVDADAQGHCALSLGLPEADGLYAALVERTPLDQVVVPVPTEKLRLAGHPDSGSLHLLPSSDRTAKIPRDLDSTDVFAFLNTLDAMSAQFNLDCIVVDTSPSVNDFDGGLYLAIDYYLYPTLCEMLSLDGLVAAIEQLKRTIQQRNHYLHRESKIIGIVPNKFQRGTLVHERNLNALTERFGDLILPPLVQRIMWVEASQFHQTIFEKAPKGKEAAEMWAIIRKIEGVLWPTTEKQP